MRVTPTRYRFEFRLRRGIKVFFATPVMKRILLNNGNGTPRQDADNIQEWKGGEMENFKNLRDISLGFSLADE